MPTPGKLNPPMLSKISNPCGKDGKEKLLKHRKENMVRAGVREGKNPLR